MGKVATTVAFTSGTSLKTNLAGADGDYAAWLGRQPAADQAALSLGRERIRAAARAAADGFRLSPGADGMPSIVCTHVDGNYPAVFVLKTTATTRPKQEDALAFLESRFGN